MTDIKTDVPASAFDQPPAEYQKIEAEQVRAQVNLVFNSLAAVISQMMNQSQQQTALPTATPTH